MKTLKWMAALALGLLTISGAASAQKKYDPGASDTEIRLGMPMPLSGPVSSYAVVGKVTEAYFRMVNERGGINGRKVRIFSYDDQYSPPRTVEVARRMVEEDQVLAMFGNLGTASNLAIQRYMTARRVPHLFVQSGASKLNDARNSPYTVPYLGSYQGEGQAVARLVLQQKPAPKIGVLMQNDDLGRELLKGLKTGLGAQADKAIVREATYEVSDPTVDSQIVSLKSAGADTLLIFGTARFAAQALRKASDIGWRPNLRYVNYAAASIKVVFLPVGADITKGVRTMGMYKEPEDPRWADDAELKEYRELLQKYAPEVDWKNDLGLGGYAMAQLVEHVLRQAGDNLTRDNILRIASNLNGFHARMMLPGVTLFNSPADLHAVASYQPVVFNGRELETAGPVLKLK